MHTTEQAAVLLGIGQARVRALIRAGTLDATKVGRDWLINDRSLRALAAQPRPAGPRALSPVNAWRLAWEADEGRRVGQKRVRRPVEKPAETAVSVGAWRTRMRGRASQCVRGWTAPANIEGLRTDARVVVFDSRRWMEPSEVVSGLATVWTGPSDLADVLRSHVLDSNEFNVVVRACPPEVEKDLYVRGVPRLVAGADLLDEPGAREQRLGSSLVADAWASLNVESER